MNVLKLEEIAEQKGVTKKELAETIGMSPQNFSRLLKKKDFYVSDLEKIAERLNVSVTEFFDVKGDVVNQSIIGGVSGTVTGIDRRQYYSDSPDVLKAQVELLEERIKEKDSQIKEKDSQINSLLSILKGK